MDMNEEFIVHFPAVFMFSSVFPSIIQYLHEWDITIIEG